MPPTASTVSPAPMSTLPPTVAGLAPESAGPAAMRQAWKLTRNCAIPPRIFFWNIGALGLVLAAVGTAFWVAGYPLVMFFCGCQLVALCAAALMHARHATDGERVRIEGGRVRVESSRGGHERVFDAHACWVRLERASSGGLVLRSGRTELPVGEQLTPAQRRVFAEEFAASIARARQWDASSPAASENEPA